MGAYLSCIQSTISSPLISLDTYDDPWRTIKLSDGTMYVHVHSSWISSHIYFTIRALSNAAAY